MILVDLNRPVVLNVIIAQLRETETCGHINSCHQLFQLFRENEIVKKSCEKQKGKISQENNVQVTEHEEF